MNRKELTDLLHKNQFEQLLDHLGEIAILKKKGNLTATISLISSQYHKTKQAELRGVETSEKINLEYNVLREKILEAIVELFQEEKTYYQQMAWKHLLYSFVIISLFSAILFWGMQIQPGWTTFTLEAEVDQIGFEVGAKKDFISEKLPVGMLVAEPLTVCVFEDQTHQTLNHYMEVEGDVSLRELVLGKNTKMTVNKDFSDLIFSFSGNFITAALVGEGNASLDISPHLPASDLPYSIPFNQTVEFQTAKSHSNLMLSPNDSTHFSVSDITLTKLVGFSEIDPSTGIPVSTLKRGTLTYGKKDTVLQEFQTIDMEGIKNGKLNIENAEEFLKITLEGSAYNLQIGYPGTLHPLTQSSRIENYVSGSSVNLIFQLLVVVAGLLLASIVFLRKKRKKFR